ncbi:hypothetical protein [Gottfriedia endophytica]|uniref:hypothetical protein n=1 Tax=Gottfriedia endophytica TaxID=2820819 RepID=UPI001FD74357|nr:hypothetical protein [Gottfriedia endophytica]
MEHIGNKIPFEKKLNIIASNGYFKKIQEGYNKSKVQFLLDLSNQHNEWGLNQSELPVQEKQSPVPNAE